MNWKKIISDLVAAKLTQKEIAKRIGVTQSAISQILSGKNPLRRGLGMNLGSASSRYINHMVETITCSGRSLLLRLLPLLAPRQRGAVRRRDEHFRCPLSSSACRSRKSDAQVPLGISPRSAFAS